MTAGFVADSSVAIAWVLPSQATRASDSLIQDIHDGAPFFVPTLWMFEVANALLVLTRRLRIDQEKYVQARHFLGKLHAAVDDEGHRAALGDISDLATRHTLSVYDATYLELAIRRGVPLATRDAALNKAAKQSGVRTPLAVR